MTSETSNQ